jgi:hypothetical protein
VIHNINRSGRSGGGTAVLLLEKNYRTWDVGRDVAPSGYTSSPSSERRDRKLALKIDFCFKATCEIPLESIYGQASSTQRNPQLIHGDFFPPSSPIMRDATSNRALSPAIF